LPYNSNWIAGFANGDGSFILSYYKDSRMRLGATCNPLFKVTQHLRDRLLLERILTSLDCGFIYNIRKDLLDFRITGLPTITSKVIPFFTENR